MGVGWAIALMVAALVLIAATIAGVVWLVARSIRYRERTAAHRAPGGALEVLERRYAAGEINADEYRERRATLDPGR